MNTSFQGTTEKGKGEWLTPPYIIEALGPFDLDPCAPVKRPWPTAKKHYTIEDNGLILPWEGKVWCNPEYNDIEQWFTKSADHNNTLGICWASTETKWFNRTIWERAHAVLFLTHREAFYHVDGTKGGSPGKGSVIVAWGRKPAMDLWSANFYKKISGKFIRLK